MFFIIMAHSLMPCHSAIIIHGTLADAMSFMHSSCMVHSLMPCHVFHHHGTLTGAMSFNQTMQSKFNQIIHFQSSQHPHWCYVIQSNNAAQLQSSNADHPMQMQLTQCRSCNAMQNTINRSGVGGWDTNSMNHDQTLIRWCAGSCSIFNEVSTGRHLKEKGGFQVFWPRE